LFYVSGLQPDKFVALDITVSLGWIKDWAEIRIETAILAQKSFLAEVAATSWKMRDMKQKTRIAEEARRHLGRSDPGNDICAETTNGRIVMCWRFSP
jgi:hypothetical protein